jgi:DNA-directed RNA polymerase specialized sigma24 family protein
MTAAHGWLMGGINLSGAGPWQSEVESDLWLYRDRTVSMLKRYARSSVEVGRLPSLLGREYFGARVTRYSMRNFEDIMIFVHDMEQALAKLTKLEQKLIAMNVLEEYTQWEIARLMGCSTRWVEMQVPEAIDRVTQILLEWGLIEKMATPTRRSKTCQEGESDDFAASDSKDSQNIF